MHSLTTFKATINRYTTISAHDWALFSAKATCRTLSKGEKLIDAGVVCNKMWYVAQGLIGYYQYDAHKAQQKATCFAMEHHFSTPFTSYLTGAPTHEILVALEPCSMVEMQKHDFQHFVETMPSINSMYRQVLEEAYLHMEKLNYMLQQSTATERYQKLILEDAPHLLQRVPLIYLASYLGISPETLSRVRARV